MTIKHVVSVSSGKDSDSTLLIALDRFGKRNVIPIFCDTGNEHEEVYCHLNYLELALDIKIIRLKANFDNEIANKRMFIARDTRSQRDYKKVEKTNNDGNPVYCKNKDGSVRMLPVYNKSIEGELVILKFVPEQKMGYDGGRKRRWSNKSKRRALEVLTPTGNPYLDLCLWKGRFPSRKAQFCTEELKRNPAVDFQLELVAQGYTVVSWQGVRRDESDKRKNALKFERIGPGMYAYRPIVEWTAAMTFDFISAHGLFPNSLYKQGMGRVGCMPCINARKDELHQIARRFPEHIERISEWEALVSSASKHQVATFIPAPEIKNLVNKQEGAKKNGIWSVIEWAKTTRGGKQYDLLANVEDVHVCSSAYGLCE
jgi:3'-phosphoadenosine 5'-phosphosulfate sulfotransferase (PAPS reductase)/FAD synthetase